MTTEDIATVTESNREAWDISAKHHQESEEWSKICISVREADFNCFDKAMTAALNKMNLSGKNVVQIGCNNGREILSLDSFGAGKCLGIDQSQQFINQANELNDIAKKSSEFICANIYNLPNDVPRGFDMALITIGVLSWMPDLSKFFKTIAELLNENGQLIIYETHPFLEQFEPNSETPFTLEHSYFRTEPIIEDTVITYDGSKHDGGVKSYWYIHTLSKIFTKIMDAKFQVTCFEEYAHSNREVDYSIYENAPTQIPMCYILKAKLSKDNG